MTNYLTALNDLNEVSENMPKLQDFMSELPDDIYYQFLDIYYQFLDIYTELTLKLDQSIGVLERIRDRLQVRLKIVDAYAACDTDGINVTKIQQTINQLLDLVGTKED